MKALMSRRDALREQCNQVENKIYDLRRQGWEQESRKKARKM